MQTGGLSLKIKNKKGSLDVKMLWWKYLEDEPKLSQFILSQLVLLFWKNGYVPSQNHDPLLLVFFSVYIYISCCGSIFILISWPFTGKNTFFKHDVKRKTPMFESECFILSIDDNERENEVIMPCQCFICMLQIKESCLTFQRCPCVFCQLWSHCSFCRT